MTDTTVDVFSEIDLEEFKKPKKKGTDLKPSHKEKEAIRIIAQENDFQSREPIKPKGIKIVPKTFSLFKEDLEVINSVIQNYLLDYDPGFRQPSGSDIVRAALHHFIKQSPEDQVRQIKERRGRGK